MLLRGRIAPTPSGYLHIGNVLNFVRTWLMVRKQKGVLRLRIDDSDTTRSKPEYIEDIFRTLDWLGLDWDEGPQSPDEQLKQYSQALRAERYAQVTKQLVEAGHVFACECSRKDLQQRDCNCRHKGLSFDQVDTSLRIITPDEPVIVNDIQRGALPVELKDSIKNFVIRRRDGIAAYQLCSLSDDIDHNIHVIIRGEDLLDSTAAQLLMAGMIEDNNFAATRFYHHKLMYDEQGKKLSKSAGSLSLKTMREQGITSQQLYSWISKLSGWEETVTSLHEMLNFEVAIQ